MEFVVFLKRLATKTTKSAAPLTRCLRKTQPQATLSAASPTRSTPTDTVVLRVSTMNRVSAAKQVSLEEEESAAKKRITSTQRGSAAMLVSTTTITCAVLMEKEMIAAFAVV